MNIVTVTSGIERSPEIFKPIRCPQYPTWFGYIKYKDQVEYQGKMYPKSAEMKVRDDIVTRIENAVGQLIKTAEIHKELDMEGNIMFYYKLIDLNSNPIRTDMTRQHLQVLLDNRSWINVDLVRKVKVEEDEEQPAYENTEYEGWKRIRTRVGKDKLLETLDNILSGNDAYNPISAIKDFKIHVSDEVGMYALHKLEK